MSVDVEAPEAPSPGGRGDDARGRRRHLAYWAFVVALVALLAYGLYGGRLGGVSSPRRVRGELQTLTYPSAFGGARVRRLAPGYERVQVAGFGEEPARGPAGVVQGVLQITRAGGLLFEVRGLASDGERDALLERTPYACGGETETRLVDTVAGIEIRRVQRGVLFRWLPASVQLCGTRVNGHVLSHVSGFASDATWYREAASIRAMLEGWRVKTEAVPHAADGCRMHVGHEPPLYVKFRSEALAQRGEISGQTVQWIDLPFRGEDSVGRFTPDQLEEVAGACAEEQARFAQLVDSGIDPQSPEAQDAQHAFQVRCEPLFPMLRFFGAEKLEPEALPRPSQGWRQRLDEQWVPALCLPAPG